MKDVTSQLLAGGLKLIGNFFPRPVRFSRLVQGFGGCHLLGRFPVIIESVEYHPMDSSADPPGSW